MYFSHLFYVDYFLIIIRYYGGYYDEAPPLPIPNREVKLICADGTAFNCGRVGNRHLSGIVFLHCPTFFLLFLKKINLFTPPNTLSVSTLNKLTPPDKQSVRIVHKLSV